MKTLTVEWLKPARKETQTRNMSRDWAYGRLMSMLREMVESAEEHAEVEVRIKIVKQAGRLPSSEQKP